MGVGGSMHSSFPKPGTMILQKLCLLTPAMLSAANRGYCIPLSKLVGMMMACCVADCAVLLIVRPAQTKDHHHFRTV